MIKGKFTGIFVLEFFKFIWRLVQRQALRKKNVDVSSRTRFNNRTVFHGYNKIQADVCVANSEIGRYTYIGERSNLQNCLIGAFCSIARDVAVEAYTHPTRGFVSTSPVFFSTLKQCGKSFVSENRFTEHLSIEGYNAIIGNDVWIGSQALIIGGVKIGDGAIIAAGSVVTKDVPPFAIVGGVPAKVIRYRFNDDEIKKILKIQWWNKSEEWLLKNKDFFSSIDVFLKCN